MEEVTTCNHVKLEDPTNKTNTFCKLCGSIYNSNVSTNFLIIIFNFNR